MSKMLLGTSILFQAEFYKCSMTSEETIVDFLGKLKVIISHLAARGDTIFNDDAVISKILCSLTEFLHKVHADSNTPTSSAYLASAKGKKPNNSS